MVSLRLLTITICVWCLATISAQATTYYVDISGSDANNGTSEATPFRTVKKGAELMVAGDTTYVKSGTYAENLIRMRNSGTVSARITLAAYPGHAPIIAFNDSISTPVYARLLLQSSPGHNLPIRYITIDGFTFRNGVNGVRWYNCQNCIIRRNRIEEPYGSGMLGTGGIDNVIEQNIIIGAGDPTTGAHGLYLTGSRYLIRKNLIYGGEVYGIQLKGNADLNDTVNYAGPEFAATNNAVITDNLIAYQRIGAGVVLWNTHVNNTRIENNIFYENEVAGTAAESNAIRYVSAFSTGSQFRNNHVYASGSGGTTFVSSSSPPDGVEGVNYTQSGNVVNVSPPAFINGGNNALPASPDFSLTASAPVNIAFANEFPNNTTNVVGPFKTVAAPACSMISNKITCIFNMNTAVPIQNLSATGITINCTGVNCPAGGLTAGGVSRVVGTDTRVEILVVGFTGDACVAENQSVTLSYGATGVWTGNDSIGPAPGLHQKILPFTNLAVTNNCTGSGPTSYPAGYHIFYKFNEGVGTNVNDESANNLDGTFIDTPTWGTGKIGTGMEVAAGSTQHTAIPWGNGVNPSTQSMTIVLPVQIAVGTESATHYVAGPSHGTNQRAYVCALSGTWRIALQGTTCSATTTSSLAVTSGWNHLVLRFDSGTDTATLYNNGVAGTGGASVAYTSYIFASNWTLGRVATLASSGGTYDDFLVYLSLVDPAAIYTAFQTTTAPPGGTFVQAASQAQAVYLSAAGGAPANLVALNAAKKVTVQGAVAWVLQIHCDNIADCVSTAFRLAYRKNGTGAWQQVPDTETADGIFMWGASSDSLLNAGAITSRLTGSCAVTNGITLLTSAQVPSVDLPQDGCIMLRWIVRIGTMDTSSNPYFELRAEIEGGSAFTGAYTLARINVIASQSGVGP